MEIQELEQKIAEREYEPKYPEITVKLTGVNGNAYNILSIVRKALLNNGVSIEEIREFFLPEAMKNDYDHLLRTCIKWVNVE